MDQIYLRPSELANRYNNQISEKTLANWRVSGRGPRFCKIGGKIFYAIEQVLEWEKKNTNLSTSEYKSASMVMLAGWNWWLPFEITQEILMIAV